MRSQNRQNLNHQKECTKVSEPIIDRPGTEIAFRKKSGPTFPRV